MSTVNGTLASSSRTFRDMRGYSVWDASDLEDIAERVASTDSTVSEKAVQDLGSLLRSVELFEARMKIETEFLASIKKDAEKLLETKRNTLLDQLKTIKAWADVEVPELYDTSGAVVKMISEESYKSKVADAVPESTSGCKFGVLRKVDAGTTWVRMEVPVVSVDLGSVSMKLIHVVDDDQLHKLPAGVLVYHSGMKVPKVVLTTGMTNAPAVVTNCRMWDTKNKETLCKYSLFNNSIQKNTGNISSFYIDEKVSGQVDIPEDTFRNFRVADRAHSGTSDKPERRGWSGYSVHGMHNFGDSRLLREQFEKVTLDDAADLYQYSLWMLLVSVAHCQSQVPPPKKRRNNKQTA
jgi:hypothetical protein